MVSHYASLIQLRDMQAVVEDRLSRSKSELQVVTGQIAAFSEIASVLRNRIQLLEMEQSGEIVHETTNS